MAGLPFLLPLTNNPILVGGLSFGVGLLFGMILGWFLYQMFQRWWGRRYQYILDLFSKATLIGIIDDVKENKLELVPLVPLKPGLYVSISRDLPYVVFTNPNAKPRWSFLLGKPILYGISWDIYATAVDPKLLAPFGIAKLTLKVDELDYEVGNEAQLNKLIEALIKKISEGASGEVAIGPDMKLGIMYDIPALVRSLLSLIKNIGSASFVEIQETSQTALELAQYAQRSAYIQLARQTTWLKFALIMLILVGMLALIAAVLLPMLPHLMGAATHAIPIAHAR
ncbi:MAG: hypothetical protein GXO26_04355 [Crenarchaeota archaeon]|nr:hypothetical protein [Thermoproteota archaeon]